MEYLIAAIVLGMLIWAGFEIVQTIRNWESNSAKTASQIQPEMIEETYHLQPASDVLEVGSQAVGQAIHASHCATEAACETTPAIGHIVEALLHGVHH
ncbi:hypothetical protein [Tychonema sp. BBK16]|uniref:hypothetical protein n=1 Tax=Tychonema sp. BBK16 TaxID=2699888 RepID=UPI001F39D2D4|nr:hypothetical protein [Tychonema sp. BBK16]MCF6372234.1 hypothetical protein [Tychonema sp. BBK16]